LLRDALRLDPSRSASEMAEAFAEELDAATAGCAVKRIVHDPGSPVVTADLGLGCTEGHGELTVTFARQGEGARAVFDFREFAFEDSHLDGRWQASIRGDGSPRFQGAPPWKDLLPAAPPRAVAVASRRTSRETEEAFQALRIAAGVVYLAFLPLVIAIQY